MDLIDLQRPRPNWRMIRWELLIVLLLVAWLAACSTVYVPSGSGRQTSFDEANGECFYRRSTVPMAAMARVYELCMRQHGWRPE